MRFLLIFLSLAAGSIHAETQSALDALKLLPKNAAKRLARIEAREGTPGPEQWHFVVYDPETANGLREYVVAGKQIVATRDISQFAETLQPGDVIGARALKIDSGKLAGMAEKYALANNVTIASVNYEMHKEGQAAAPFWAVTCLDANGDELGALLVSADAGKIISRTGFPVEPQNNVVSKRGRKTEEQIRRSDAAALDEEVPGPEQVETTRPEGIAVTRQERVEVTREEELPRERPPERERSTVVIRHRSTTSNERAVVPSVPTVVRKVTKPVRRIVRSLLPF
ncbi:MAG: hypothetical protein JWL59_3192 [Chthoniobacteraceae bacterium]|nr:hypothetical protein [Chthoniobacteraceae bacterium]